jgi:hypothetical protein
LCQDVILSLIFQEDKKKKKKEKVKPILLNKDEQSHIVEVAPVPANHFEEIQPKDDLLLKQKGNVSVCSSHILTAIVSVTRHFALVVCTFDLHSTCPGLRFDPETGYPDQDFRGFILSLHEDTKIVFQIGPHPFQFIIQ